MLYDKILDLVFPRRCPVCDEPVRGYGKLICTECESIPEILQGALCRKCGKKLQEEEREYCYDCSRKKHNYKEGAALFSYTTIKKSVYRFKYKGRVEYADYYAWQLEKNLGEKIRQWKPDALVPIPIHPSRRRTRGYNQAEELAKALGKRMGIPAACHLMERVKKTAPQKLLNDTQRQNNLKRAFKIRQNDVKLDTIVIIDDIYTTGSTVDAAAEECLAAGVENIYFVTLAIGEGL